MSLDIKSLKNTAIIKMYLMLLAAVDTAATCCQMWLKLLQVVTIVKMRSPTLISIGKKVFFSKNNLKFIELNIEDKPLIGDCDVFVSLETIEHIDHSIEETILFYKKNIRKGGMLIFSCPQNEDDLGMNSYHKHFNLTKVMIKKILLDCNFEINEVIIQKGYEGFYNYLVHVATLKN